MKKIIWMAGLCALLLCPACKNNIVYSDVKNLPVSGWEIADTAEFTFHATDTTASYQVLLHVRHRKNYPYQNMWLFVEKQLSDSAVLSDTIEFYLADQRGRWLGNGIGSILEMPVLYEYDVHFPQAGDYTYRITQGMREDTLAGVNDIGISIEKIN